MRIKEEEECWQELLNWIGKATNRIVGLMISQVILFVLVIYLMVSK